MKLGVSLASLLLAQSASFTCASFTVDDMLYCSVLCALLQAATGRPAVSTCNPKSNVKMKHRAYSNKTDICTPATEALLAPVYFNIKLSRILQILSSDNHPRMPL